MQPVDHFLIFLKSLLSVVGVLTTLYGIYLFLKNKYLTLPIAYQVSIAGILMLVSLWMFGIYFTKIESYAEFMDQAITTKLMTNDQPYKTVEAYALSELYHKVDGNTDTDRKIRSNIDSFQVVLDRLDDITSSKHYREKMDEEWRALNLSPDSFYWYGKPDSGLLTNNDPNYFLFQPGFSFQGFPESNAASRIRKSQDIEFQLLAACNAKKWLTNILHENKIDDLAIAQCFFTNDMGTLFITGKENGYSPKLFPPRKYFADRPYFWNAQSKTDAVGVYDHVSVPYIDYGGNGIVRSYCFKVNLPYKRRGIIAIDCVLSDDLSPLIDKFEKICEGWVLLDINNSTHTVTIASSNKNPDAFQRDISNIKSKRALQDKIVRGVDLLPSTDSSRILCSIPIKWGDISNQVLLLEINKGFIENFLVVLFVGAILFALSIACFALLVYSHYISRNEQFSLLNRFSLVMEDSKIPFARFGANGEFESANAAWCKMLDYNNEDDMMYTNSSKKVKRKFSDLLTNEDDRERYRAAIKKSKSGENTEGETYKLRSKKGHDIEVKTHAEGVVVRHLFKPDQIKRFGIVLESKVLPETYTYK